MKDFVNLRYLNREEIENLIDLAKDIKKKNKMGIEFKPLKDKTVITSFPATSLRTRISFEAGIFQLGGQSINMIIDFQGKEPMKDKVGYLNCWINSLIIRNPNQDLIEEIAKEAEFSVINAMSKKYHPCEILGDLQTINELRGDLRNLKFVFLGEGANISNTWFEAAAKLDLNITQICPKGYEIEDSIFKYAKDNSKGDISITNDVEGGLRNADIVLTDGWPIKEVGDEKYYEFLPYQITLDKLKLTNKSCIVNPCPPFTRGNEIADEVLQSQYFIGYKGKENLLHMHKAILASLQS